MSKTSKIANIYTVFDATVEKLWVSAFQNFFRIENPLNIKEVMSKNMFVYILSFFWTFDQLFLFITIFDTFNMKVIT